MLKRVEIFQLEPVLQHLRFDNVVGIIRRDDEKSNTPVGVVKFPVGDTPERRPQNHSDFRKIWKRKRYPGSLTSFKRMAVKSATTSTLREHTCLGYHGHHLKARYASRPTEYTNFYLCPTQRMGQGVAVGVISMRLISLVCISNVLHIKSIVIQNRNKNPNRVWQSTCLGSLMRMPVDISEACTLFLTSLCQYIRFM